MLEVAMHDARVETHEDRGTGRQDRPFGVTVKTLAGHSRHDQVRPSDRVQDVMTAAVRFFVSRRELDDGPYSLTLPRLGDADLDPTGTLADVGVVRDDVLVLVSRTPQVDG
jgi:hypothetical protein